MWRRRWFRASLPVLACLATACAARGGPRVPPPPPPPLVASPTHDAVGAPVGLTTRVFTDTRRARTLATTVWYPAVPGTNEQEIEWDGIFLGSGAWNAAIRRSPARMPLVLLSHGSGADGSNLTWLAEALASHGYVVAAMDHPGDRFGDSSQEGRFAAWRRPRDVSVVLDGLLADRALGPRIDPARVGVAGHSSGGYTALALVGARFRPQQYLDYCKGKRRGLDCVLFRGLDTKGIPDLADGEKSYRDARIRVALALAPVLGPAATRASLRRVARPVTIVASRKDHLATFTSNAARYAGAIPRARLVALPKGGHFVFMPRCTLPGKIVAAPLCDDLPGVDREAVHTRVIALAIELFDRRIGAPAVRR